MLFANLPRDAFLRAASYSSVAMMAASLTSDYMGFGLAMRHKDSSYMFTFYLTIASSSAALLLVVMGSVANVIPPLPTSLPRCASSPDPPTATRRPKAHPEPVCSAAAHPDQPSAPWTQAIAAATRCLRDYQVLLWLALYALVRAVHTTVMTLWSLLVIDFDHDHIHYNGLVVGVSYTCASAVVLALQHVPRCRRLVDVMASRCAAHAFCFAALLCSGGALVALSFARTIVTIGVALLLFHATAEVVLVIAAAHLGLRIASVSSRQPSARATEANPRRKQLPMYEQQHQQEQGQEREQEGAPGRQQPQRLYLLTMAARFVLSLCLQATLQLVIWPKWGRMHNIFGLKLSLAAQMQAYGAAMLVSAAACIPLAIRHHACMRTQRHSGTTAATAAAIADASHSTQQALAPSNTRGDRWRGACSSLSSPALGRIALNDGDDDDDDDDDDDEGGNGGEGGTVLFQPHSETSPLLSS